MRRRDTDLPPADLIALTREADRLDRAWDTIVGSRQVDTNGTVRDPDQLLTIRRLHALALGADTAAARDRVRDRIVAARPEERTAMQATPAVLAPDGAATSAGPRVEPLARPPRRMHRRSIPRRFSPALQYAASIILIAGLIGGYFAATRQGPGNVGMQGADATPPPTTIPGHLTLVSGRYAAAEPGLNQVAVLVRWLKLSPDSKLSQPFAGTALHYVESGTLTFGRSAREVGHVTLGAGLPYSAEGDLLLSIENSGDKTADVLQVLVYDATTDFDATWGAPLPLDDGNAQLIAFTTFGVMDPGAFISVSELGVTDQDYQALGLGGSQSALVAVQSGEVWVIPNGTDVGVARNVPNRTDLGPAAAKTEPVRDGPEVILASGDTATVINGPGFDLRSTSARPASVVVVQLRPMSSAVIATEVATPD